ncbi:hypothetical protein [Polaribacter sp. Hel1_85]|uniref:hypothetical protein n=1 Tax=Polaribacter sp. Hel1_85 TaxID=1250005 RepID=UPI00052E3261|nr:hypothetical protein [Polaribacter sp. Hel1_85]KGL64114.1 hypothetical protein PHEL85_1165 [Polaribacter sp. Hel1_85]
MKNTIQKLTLILVVSFTFLVGCTEFFDKIDDFNVGVTNTIFEQSAVIELQDYFGDQQNIIDTNLKVEFSGADADKLVNEAGEFTISETDGFIQLNVNPNKSTGVKELNFDVTISGGDYTTTTYPVTLTDTVSHIKLPLVDDSKIYKGTNTASKTVSLTNNTTTIATTTKTSLTNSLTTSSVTIKTGTQFKDASDNVLTGSNVNIEVTNTDPLSEVLPPTSILTFKDSNDAEITGKEATFVTGNTNIKMDVNSTAVKKFTNAIDVAIEIPSDATNPNTGNQVQLGDTFPVYTNEEESFNWTYHGLGTVTAGNTADTFNISFETTHLSNYTVVNFKDTNCSNNTYNITANNLPDNYSATFEIILRTVYEGSFNIFPGDRYYYAFEIKIVNGKVVSVDTPRQSFPSNYIKGSKEYDEEVNIHINSLGGSEEDWTTTIFDTSYIDDIKSLLASGNDVNIVTHTGSIWGKSTYESQLYVTSKGVIYRTNLSSIATFANCELNINLTQDGTDYFNIGNLKNIAIDVAANCNNKTFVPDGFPFYVERENGIFSYEGTIKEGKMTLKGFELGKEYNFKTVYKGQSYFHKWTFDSEIFTDKNFEVPQSACDALNI